MIAEYKFLNDPKNNLIEDLKVKLSETVKNSNGMLRGFRLYKDNGTFGHGKYYPKRMRTYNPNPEDVGIFLGGVQIGYMVNNIPFLHT